MNFYFKMLISTGLDLFCLRSTIRKVINQMCLVLESHRSVNYEMELNTEQPDNTLDFAWIDSCFLFLLWLFTPAWLEIDTPHKETRFGGALLQTGRKPADWLPTQEPGYVIHCLWVYYGCFMGGTQLISQQLWLHFADARMCKPKIVIDNVILN